MRQNNSGTKDGLCYHPARFAISYLCGIQTADPLDIMSIGGFKLGFWSANQGSQVIFVMLICVYGWLTNNLDQQYAIHED